MGWLTRLPKVARVVFFARFTVVLCLRLQLAAAVEAPQSQYCQYIVRSRFIDTVLGRLIGADRVCIIRAAPRSTRLGESLDYPRTTSYGRRHLGARSWPSPWGVSRRRRCVNQGGGRARWGARARAGERGRTQGKSREGRSQAPCADGGGKEPRARLSGSHTRAMD